MSRLTKKFEDNSGYTPVVNHSVRKGINLYDFEEVDYDCCVEKLGKLEDLEEELNIDLLELLEDFKKTKEELKDILNEHPEITPDYMAYTLSNGITYRKLTEELGCPLDVVFKAMTMGIMLKNSDEFWEHNYSESDEKYVYFSTEEISLKNWQCHGIDNVTNSFQINFGDDNEFCVYLKDYGKRWWLKGE